MEKLRSRLLLSVIVVMAVLVTSCGKKMEPLPDSLFNATPSPMELIGTKVPVTVNGRFPAKWFDKNATVTITPVIKWANGEALGESVTYQGTKVAGNGVVVDQENGGNITLRHAFDYTPEMSKSELVLRFEISKKGKSQGEYPDVKVADGVLATAALANAYSTTPAVAPDAFQRIIKEAHEADIMFLVNRAELRSKELNSNNMDAWKDLVKEASDNDRKKISVEVSAYASPEGGFKYNDALAEKREKNTSKYLTGEFRKKHIESGVLANYTAQDWEGFKRLVEASSLQDKNLVLSVLSMYSDPAEREREIRNLSTVYSELAETILPRLRRSRLTANVEVIGKSDDEILNAAVGDMSDLSLEELLYATTLAPAKREAVNTVITKRYPNDYRGWNNLGAYYFENGDYDKATSAFNRARNASTNAVEANMNTALLAMADGKTAEAERLLGSASGANTLNEALGLLYIQKGEYSKAATAFGDSKTNNAAIAHILTKNYNAAQRALSGVAKADGTTSYLAAVVAAKTNNTSGVISNLREALRGGISKKQIANDIEFARFVSNSDFQSIIQ